VKEDLQQAIRDLFFMILVEMVCTPLGLYTWIIFGFHLIHVVILVAYVAAVVRLFSAANIIVKYVRLVNSEKDMRK
jgi:hypothetical protein